MKCHQCANNAFYKVHGYPLCVECATKVHQMEQEKLRMLKEQANYYQDEINATLGVDLGFPRYDVSKPKTPAKLTFNNLNLTNSVVGAINTGEARNIDVSLSRISVGGHAELSKALAAFTQQVIDSNELTKQAKDELLEMLSTVTSEVAKPTADRRQGVLKGMVQGIATAASVTASLAASWDKVHPLITALLHHLPK